MFTSAGRDMIRRLAALILLPLMALGLAACVPMPPPQKIISPHVLDDRIWSVSEQRFIDSPELVRQMTATRFLLLGEHHDNPRHHELQAWVVRALVEKNRRLVLVAEMIAADQANALKLFYENPHENTGLLRMFLDWDKSGWPDWTYYAPVFNAALRGGYDIRPGNLDRSLLPAMHKTGWAALDDGTRDRLDLPAALPDSIGSALRTAINDSHCSALPDRVLTPFAEIQFARDAQMAVQMQQALKDAKGGDGAILIAGAEHVRNDRGVPYHLRRLKAGGRVLSLAFVETRDGKPMPADYDLGNYDFVWFTPSLDRASPCPLKN